VTITDLTLAPGSLPEGGVITPTPRRRHIGRWIAILAGVLVVALAGFILWVIQPTDLYAIRPGSVRDTTSAITVDGAEFHDPVGEIGFTTISLTPGITRWQEWRMNDDPTIDLVPSELIDGERTREERQAANLASMEGSKDLATVVAMDFLGIDGVTTGEGALVRAVLEGSPAEGVLIPTDVVVAVDDERIDFAGELVAAMKLHSVGDPVLLTVASLDGTIRDIEINLGANAETGAPQLGVSITTFQLSADFPVDVAIDSGAVGGPSAGLAFTLGIIDVLTPGELTGGHKVATTGTIGTSGEVGPVGGVLQKVEAARNSGVEIFIVPSIEYDEAIERAGDMQILVADTLVEAVDILREYAGVDFAMGPVSFN